MSDKVLVEVFSSPHCDRCGKTKQFVKDIVEEMNLEQLQWREVNVIEEIDYAVEVGVLSTPTIAINGDLAFTGMPSKESFLNSLKTRLILS